MVSSSVCSTLVLSNQVAVSTCFFLSLLARAGPGFCTDADACKLPVAWSNSAGAGAVASRDDYDFLEAYSVTPTLAKPN